MNGPFRLLAGVAVFLSLTPSAWAQTPSLTPELALDVRSIRIADVTEDGRWVAATVQTRRDRTNVDHRRFGDPTYVSPVASRLLVIDTETGDEVWVEGDPLPLRSIQWSANGVLAYLTAVDSEFALRVWNPDWREARTVTLDDDREVASSSSLVWHPDSERVLIGLRPSGWRQNAAQAFYDVTEAPVIVQDSKEDFLSWDRVRNLANEQASVLVSVNDGSVTDLPTEDIPQNPGFSADGGTLTFTSSRRTKTTYTRRDGTDYGAFALRMGDGVLDTLVVPSEDRLSLSWSENRDAYAYTDEGDVWVRRLDSDEASNVTEASRAEGDSTRYSVVSWSPDGEQLLLSSDTGWSLLDLDDGAPRTVLAFGDDEESRPRRSALRWTDNGDHIYFSFSARDRWNRGLKRLDTESGEVDAVRVDQDLYRSWTVSSEGDVAVFLRSDGNRPDDLWVRRDGVERQLTEMNPQLADVPLTRTELIEYLDVDGNTLYGILYYPIGYQEGRTYPLVAEVYEQFFDNGYHENMNLLTAQGWFGLRPSVRFEEGFPGEAWLKAVPNAVNALIDRGLVDPEKVGVYGQSYGGYAVNLLITQTDRFAAAANVSGKVNIISFLGDSPRITTRNYAAAEVGQDRIGSSLWEQPQKYIQHSAVMFADRINTPLLMLSGEGDWNVPDTNQREMYYALRRLGKDVVWVNYTRGGHGAGRASTAEDFVDHWTRMFDWFNLHFEPTTEPPIGDSND